MLFLAWLNAPLVTRFTHAVDGLHQVQLSNSRDEFLVGLREHAVDVAVIDPSLVGYDARNPEASIAVALLASAPNASVIIYGYPTQRVVAELGTIARNHHTLFVVRDARDEAAQLRFAVSVATSVNPTFELRRSPPTACRQSSCSPGSQGPASGSWEVPGRLVAPEAARTEAQLLR